MAFGLERVDWSQPWFAGWRELGTFASELVDTQGSVCSALNVVASEEAQSESSLKFVPQTELPLEQAYEAFIFANKRVPTRDNLHDFFNGLCWLRFPQAKSRLNFLQAQEIATQGIGATRGSLRDALTLFDENVLLLQASDGVWQALQLRDWKKLFGELRHEWQSAHMVLFGHALSEKLVAPYKSITAHVYRIACDVDAKDDQALDDWLATNLQPTRSLPYQGYKLKVEISG